MPHSRPSSSFGPESVVDSAQNFLDRLSTHVSRTGPVNIHGTVYPLSTFQLDPNNNLFYFPLGETQLMISPLSYSAFQGLNGVICSLLGISKRDERLQGDLDVALFLALYSGHRETADLLLTFGANPGRESSPNGLHGAASRGLKAEICYYVNELNVDVDVNDGSSATPVMYAIQLNQLHDWDTIECLFGLGADPRAEFGDGGWTYAQHARAMGKEDLAQRLEDFAECDSPTVLASSRESSCTIDLD
jgi:ankyrin repeat protein